MKKTIAWMVHALTASGAVIGLLALWLIAQGQFITAFWCMGLCTLIDAIDGTLARSCHVKTHLPQFDGALLDNIVDFFTYTLIPAFFILKSGLMPTSLAMIAAAATVLSSAYQFCQSDAKTEDNFFKGFPSYWNIVVFYLFILQLSGAMSFVILMLFVALVFIPVKYLYPSKMQAFSHHAWARWTMLAGAVAWGVMILLLLWIYPSRSPILLIGSLAYVALYFAASIYRTLYPLPIK